MKVKRTHTFQKGSAQRHREIIEAQDRYPGAPLGSCGHLLIARPLWMVGKYDICYSCYLKREHTRRIQRRAWRRDNYRSVSPLTVYTNAVRLSPHKRR